MSDFGIRTHYLVTKNKTKNPTKQKRPKPDSLPPSFTLPQKEKYTYTNHNSEIIFKKKNNIRNPQHPIWVMECCLGVLSGKMSKTTRFVKYLGGKRPSEATRKIKWVTRFWVFFFFELRRSNLYEFSKNNELGNKLTKNCRQISWKERTRKLVLTCLLLVSSTLIHLLARSNTDSTATSTQVSFALIMELLIKQLK